MNGDVLVGVWGGSVSVQEVLWVVAGGSMQRGAWEFSGVLSLFKHETGNVKD